MTDKPRTKSSYAKPITLTPISNPYSVLASPSLSYSQATRKSSPSSPEPSLRSSPFRQLPNSSTIPEKPSSPKQSPFNLYFCKPCSLKVKLLEQDEIGPNQQPILSRIFPSMNGKIIQYHLPRGYQIPFKNQEYYEFILVDTDSAEITHKLSEPNHQEIAYSKCKIKNFITKEEWGNPFRPRTFSQNYQPPQYNYFDYQEAWFKAFYLKPTDHSWFFSFCEKFNRKIPAWVHTWWIHFGLTRDILPVTVQPGWNYFHENLRTIPYGNKSIIFTVELRVPWIMGWDFAISKTLDPQHPPILERRFRIKWWKNFQSGERLYTSQIQIWLNTFDKVSQFPQSATSASSSKTPNKKELKKKLLEELSQLGDSDDEADLSSTQPNLPIQKYLQDSQDPYEDYYQM